MSDPEVEPTGQEPEVEPEVEVEPQDDYRHKYESTEGRLRQMNDALKNAGYTFDATTNQLYGPATQQQQYQAPGPVEPEVDDSMLYDGEALRAHIQKQVEAGVNNGLTQVLGILIPVLDRNTEVAVRQDCTDWKDIKDGVMEQGKKFGFNSLTALQANPDMFNTLIMAERGKRAQQTTTNPAAEVARLQRVIAAQGLGQSEAPRASGSLNYDFNDEEREYMRTNKLTEEQYLDQIAEPAKITIGGND